MTALIGHFIFAILTWLSLTYILGSDALIGSLDKTTYTAVIGWIKYGVPIVFGIPIGHWIAGADRKKMLLHLFSIGAICFIVAQSVLVAPYTNFFLMGLVAILTVFYLPIVSKQIAFMARKQNTFTKFNAIANATQTSARFFGPMLMMVLVFVGIDIKYSIVAILIAIIFMIGFTGQSFWSDIKVQVPASLIPNIKKVVQNKVSLSSLMLYFVFYLGVAYLEFTSIRATQIGASVSYAYMYLGVGFLVGNVCLISLGSRVPKNPFILVFSLTTTGLSLIAVALFSDVIFFYSALVLVGMANSFSVTISQSLFQKYLPPELLTVFIGCLGTVTSIGALISTALFYVVTTHFGVQTALVISGLLIIASGVVWSFFKIWRTHSV